MAGATAATGTVKAADVVRLLDTTTGTLVLPGYFVGHNGVDLAWCDEDQGRGHILERDRDAG